MYLYMLKIERNIKKKKRNIYIYIINKNIKKKKKKALT